MYCDALHEQGESMTTIVESLVRCRSDCISFVHDVLITKSDIRTILYCESEFANAWFHQIHSRANASWSYLPYLPRHSILIKHFSLVHSGSVTL